MTILGPKRRKLESSTCLPEKWVCSENCIWAPWLLTKQRSTLWEVKGPLSAIYSWQTTVPKLPHLHLYAIDSATTHTHNLWTHVARCFLTLNHRFGCLAKVKLCGDLKIQISNVQEVRANWSQCIWYGQLRLTLCPSVLGSCQWWLMQLSFVGGCWRASELSPVTESNADASPRFPV